MTELSSYDQGKFDVINEIFTEIEKGKDVHEKMDKLLGKTISVLQKLNNIHVTGVAKK